MRMRVRKKKRKSMTVPFQNTRSMGHLVEVEEAAIMEFSEATSIVVVEVIQDNEDAEE